MPIPGQLTLTIKVNQLPTEVETLPANGHKRFTVDCEGREVTVTLRPKMWNLLEEAAKKYPLWVGAIGGKMSSVTPKGFELGEPNVQVFERKPRT